MDVRRAAFSGSWYPAGASECEEEINSFLKETAPPETITHPVAGIVPHAGWYFSGRIACRVISLLGKADPMPDVVVVFGMHLHPGSSAHIMAEGAWETPFGVLPVAEALGAELKKRYSFQVETTTRFTQDNTIELQLPFVKYFFPDARVLTIGAPPRDDTLDMARSVVSLAQSLDMSLRIIGSTDLTHYGPNYGYMPKGSGYEALEWVKKENDRRFIDAVLAMNPEEIISEGLEHHNACCMGAAAAAVAAAKAMGATTAESVAYATSHDRHPGDSFVGYAGILFE